MSQRTIINEIKLRQNFILISVPIIFILCCISNYVFRLSGENILLAIIFPINDSIFQHLKLCLYPTLCFWLVCYFFFRKKLEINFSNWFLSMIASSMVNIYFVLSAFCIVSTSLCIHSLILEISSLFIGIILGQLLGMHIYNHSNDHDYYISLDNMLILLIIIFSLFTFFPPELPLFAPLG